jgi:hypothetical protein
MAEDVINTTGIAGHGAGRLPSVDVDSFNIELKDDEGFLGDRASKGAFRKILDGWRKPLRKSGEDPFGDEPSEKISKKVLDEILVGDDVEASAIVHSAIEEFAQELAYVTRRFLKTKAWAKTERIVVGGGFRESRMGELAIDEGQRVVSDPHQEPRPRGLVGVARAEGEQRKPGAIEQTTTAAVPAPMPAVRTKSPIQLMKRAFVMRLSSSRARS